MRFKDIRIAYRLSLGFMSLVVITIMIGLMALQKMKLLSQQTEKMYKQPLSISNEIRDIQSNINAIQQSVKDIFTANSGTEFHEILLSINKNELNTYSAFNIVLERFDEDRHLVIDALDVFNGWKPIRERIIKYAKMRKIDKAKKVMKTRGYQHVELLGEKMELLTSVTRKNGENLFSGAQRIYEESMVSMFFLVVMSLLIGIIITIFTTISITGPLKNIIHSLNVISHDNLEAELQVERNDEIGQLANAFRAMQANLLQKAKKAKKIDEHRNWIKTGQTELYEQMRGNQEVKELANNVIRFICEYLNIQIGTLYIFYERTRHLKLRGTYSFTPPNDKAKFVKLGEGLLGQAVVDKANIKLKDIDYKYFVCNSSLAEIVPRNILIVPFMVEEKVIGVMEFGKLKHFESQDNELLAAVAENLAIAFDSSLMRYRNIRLKKKQNLI